jgi:hypothetical protein
MIKNFSDFNIYNKNIFVFEEFVLADSYIGYVSARIQEFSDLINSLGGYLIYDINKEFIKVNLNTDDKETLFILDLQSMILKRDINGKVETDSCVDIDEAMDIIEKCIYNCLGVSESGRPKADKTSIGRKVPGKYLTKNRKLMKKEIEEFQGKDSYKKDWDADYKSGKGGNGKRWETKKSAATVAYQRKYSKK